MSNTLTYRIEPVDVNNPAVELELRQVIKAAFQEKELLPQTFLANKLNSRAAKPSLFLAAIENGQIIGCNAFVAIDFIYNGNPITGYLSCWTATHPDHRRKKVFVKIINEAKRLLTEAGAGLIYGIANNNSNPIFTKKLGFTEIPAAYVRIPRIPFLLNRYFSGKPFIGQQALMVNERQVEAYKRSQFPEVIKAVRYHDSWAWGKIEIRKKWGFRIRAFYVGGIDLANPNDLPALIKTIFRQQRVPIIQISSCTRNSFNALLNHWKPSLYMNGFIYYNLNLPSFEYFNAMIGAIDVF